MRGVCRTVYGRSYEELTANEKAIIFVLGLLLFIIGALIVFYGWNIIATHYGIRQIEFFHAVIVKVMLMGLVM
jgi:hypothetical protein